MKIRISRKLIGVVIGIIVMIGVASAVAFTSPSSSSKSDQETIINCMKQAEDAALKNGNVPIDILEKNVQAGTATILTTDQAHELINEHTNYESDLLSESYRDSMQGNEETLFTRLTQYSYDNATVYPILLDCGCLNYDLKSFEINGDTAIADGTFTEYNLAIDYDQDSQKYIVRLEFYTIGSNAHMTQKDGNWVVDDPNTDNVTFAAGYDSDRGQYTTITEALDAAAKLDINAENPYK